MTHSLTTRTSLTRPHLVILGAGASLAAFPQGDIKGNKLPLMNNLVETLELSPFLNENDIDWEEGDNFEELYASLHKQSEQEKVCREIETRIFDYFSQLELPEEPTLYDHLVLSLRKKDAIATFNWDPFLWQAWNRNATSGIPTPHLMFLHGNVALGFCVEHNKAGAIDSRCGECYEPYDPSPLLYPIDQKDYASNRRCCINN